MRRLEALLGYSRGDMLRISSNADAYYRPFLKKEKLRPIQKKFKPPKRRVIDNPTGELKAIQKKIYHRILKRIEMPENLLGGVKGRTISDNAALHVGGKTLAKIDVKNFFPTITNLHVFEIWRHLLNCSPKIASLLTRLTTVKRRLPQGAPTSTLLANLVVLSIDALVRYESRRSESRYSGWVDDLAFSGENPRPLIGTTIRELAKGGFSVSRGKIKVMGPHSRKIITGVRLGKTPRPDPTQLSRVRSGIHKLRTGAVPPDQVAEYVRSLEGKISHVASIDPRRGVRLAEDLREAKQVSERT